MSLPDDTLSVRLTLKVSLGNLFLRASAKFSSTLLSCDRGGRGLGRNGSPVSCPTPLTFSPSRPTDPSAPSALRPSINIFPFNLPHRLRHLPFSKIPYPNQSRPVPVQKNAIHETLFQLLDITCVTFGTGLGIVASPPPPTRLPTPPTHLPTPQPPTHPYTTLLAYTYTPPPSTTLDYPQLFSAKVPGPILTSCHPCPARHAFHAMRVRSDK